MESRIGKVQVRVGAQPQYWVQYLILVLPCFLQVQLEWLTPVSGPIPDTGTETDITSMSRICLVLVLIPDTGINANTQAGINF